MKFQLVEFDNRHYASNIQQVDNLLKWDALGHTHHLIIRAEYGSTIKFSNMEKSEIEKYGNEQIFSGEEVRYCDDRFFVMITKGYVNNYRFLVSPATYAVFCCEYDTGTDICKIYVPNDACLYQCNVSSNVEVHITIEPVKKKWPWRNPEKQYYTVHIPMIPGYVDGSLYYTFDGCKYHYPITKAMLGKPISISAFDSKPPKIDTAIGNGYKLLIH